MDDNPLDNYNPFSEPLPRYETLPSNQNNTNNRATDSSGHDGPPRASLVPFAQEPTSFNSNMLTNDAVLALERKQAELEARAFELDRREKEQQARMNSMPTNPAPHNWPPLPSFFPCKPCVRQDFEVDIPFDCRWMARMGYGIWLSYAAILLLNMGGTLGNFIVGTGMSEGTLFGASIFIFFIMPPTSFFCWHRPLYKALRSDSSTNYLLFFAMFSVQIVIILIQCMGINYLGSCGWLNAVRTISENSSVAVLMFFVAALFTTLGVACVFLLIKVHTHYRQSGASLRKAKLEMTDAAAYKATGFGAMP